MIPVETMAQSSEYSAALENVAPDDRIEPAPFAAEKRVKLFYDESRKIQYLGFEGVLSDTAKEALYALSPSQSLRDLLDAVQAKGQAFSLIKGHLPGIPARVPMGKRPVEGGAGKMVALSWHKINKTCILCDKLVPKRHFFGYNMRIKRR